ncbi:MAG: DUF4292 domain-containing protein [Prevotellaceae bacterium]|jgi:hypothetical protein|nr:DUF4292 domain-containing protein [Prevotellaceae bacterium]
MNRLANKGKATVGTLLCIAVILICSCRTARQTTGTATDVVLPKGGMQVKQPDVQTAEFNRVSVNININGQKVSSRASIKIIRDSIIQVSVQPVLGIEIARIDLTPETAILVDKFNGKYFSTRYDSLLIKKGIELNFKHLQALLLNRLFTIPQPELTEKDLPNLFKALPYPGGTMLRSVGFANGFSVDFLINDDKQISMTVVSHPKAILRCSYSDFNEKDKITFPFRYKFELSSGNRNNGAEVILSDALFNKTVKINPTNLSNYRRVDNIEQLIPN